MSAKLSALQQRPKEAEEAADESAERTMRSWSQAAEELQSTVWAVVAEPQLQGVRGADESAAAWKDEPAMVKAMQTQNVAALAPVILLAFV